MFGLFSNSLATGSLRPGPAQLALLSAPSLAHLSGLDIAVIAIYFVMVIWIGFYLKGQATPAKSSSWPGAR